MGLLDILNGMQNGPRGQRAPDSGNTQSSGMSPITMAILALLAYKAMGSMGGGRPAPAPGPARGPQPGTVDAGLPGGGGLGDLLGGLLGGQPQGRPGQAGAPGGLGGLGGLLAGGLGGLLAGGAAGNVLSGGLGELLKQFQDNGQGEAFGSWVGTGPNRDISENDLAKSIGSEDLDALIQQTGLSRHELLSGLSQELPGVIDRLTPDGRVPSGTELSRWL
jgi:uncharacterized protein YidB (DUF937 family)